MDRDYAEPLDVPTMARHALMSPAHFSREFKTAYGETPYAYLMTRRIERAMALLRAGASVTDACTAVGATSLGSFSSTFTELVGETPTSYRIALARGRRGHARVHRQAADETDPIRIAVSAPGSARDRAGSEKRRRAPRPSVDA